MRATLEQVLLLLDSAFTRGEIKLEHRDDIFAYLKILRNRDEATFHHSVRVGLLAETIAFVANRPGITPKMMLWAGLMHDIGKSLVSPDVLSKTHEFTAEDFASVEPHPKHGWDLLNKVHDYTAHIIIRHHQFGPKPYPAVMPPLPVWLVSKEATITGAARLLALADYYDALMNRDNDKFGNEPQNAQQKREKYMLDNADEAELITKLESLGVLDFSQQ